MKQKLFCLLTTLLFLLKTMDAATSVNGLNKTGSPGKPVSILKGRDSVYFLNQKSRPIRKYVYADNNWTGSGSFTGVLSAAEFFGTGYPYTSYFGSGADITTTYLRAGSTSGLESMIMLEGGNAASPNRITFKTASTVAMTIAANRYVGIGTGSNAPSALFQVGGTEQGTVSIKGSVSAAPVLDIDNEAVSSGRKYSFSFKNNPSQLTLSDPTDGIDVMNFFANGAVTIPNGNVGIGVLSPSAKLEVNGNIKAKKVTVTQSGWPDYVFQPTYRLRPLAEVEAFIKANQHLPELPSAKEVEEKGVNLGENQALMLKKIEELTLYIIHQQKQIDAQNEMIQQLQKKTNNQ